MKLIKVMKKSEKLKLIAKVKRRLCLKCPRENLLEFLMILSLLLRLIIKIVSYLEVKMF